MNDIEGILAECDADDSGQDSTPSHGIRSGRISSRYRELSKVLRPILGRKGTARLTHRARQHASGLVANADRQIRTQERDLFGAGGEGTGKRTGRLRNQRAENELHKYYKMDSTGVLVTPSTKNTALRGPGWGIGVDPPDPYVWAYLLGQLPQVKQAWDYGFDDASTLKIVAYTIGRCQRKAATAVSLMRPGATRQADTASPLRKVANLHPERVVVADDTVDSEYEEFIVSKPDLVTIHLPPPIDRWNVIDHVVAGTADLVAGAYSGRNGLELANTIEAYRDLTYYRLDQLLRKLPCWATIIAISIPATMGLPRFVDRCAADLGLAPASTTYDHIRTYQKSDPRFLNADESDPKWDSGAGPRHPGNGSILWPRVLSLWTTAKIVSL
jgi:hypothetical protein